MFPEDLYLEYKEFFDKKTWFELMEYDTTQYYKTISECVEGIEKLSGKLSKKYNGQINPKIYNKLRKLDNRLPPFPEEYFKKNNFTTVEKEFVLETNNYDVDFI